MSKGNIAVFFSGQVRTLDHIIYYLNKNLLFDKNFNYYIFCLVDKIDSNKVITLLSPTITAYYEEKKYINIIIRNISNNNYKDYYLEEISINSTRNYIYQLNKLQESFELCKKYSIEHNIIFDAVVRMRYDFAILNEINFINILKELGDKTLILPMLGIKQPTGFWQEMYNDTFAIGTMHSMNIYCKQLETLVINLNADDSYKKTYVKYGVNLIKYMKRLLYRIGNKENKLLAGIGNIFSLILESFLIGTREKYSLTPEKLLFYHLRKNEIHVIEKKIDFVLVRQNPEYGGHICVINLN